MTRLRRTAPLAIWLVIVAACIASSTGCTKEEGDVQILPDDVYSASVIVDPDLIVAESSCGIGYRYVVRVAMLNVPAGVTVAKVNITSNCGGSDSVLGASGIGYITLTSCGPQCSIVGSAVMDKGTAIPGEEPVNPCGDLGCSGFSVFGPTLQR